MPVIGFLNPASLDTGRDWIAAFYQGLAEAGPSNEVELLGGNGQLLAELRMSALTLPVLAGWSLQTGSSRSANYVVSFLTYTSSFQYSLTSYFRTSSTHVVSTPRRGISRL
jgi:hypothetical protein